MAVHQRNFRDGAFKPKITKNTTVIEAFNIFITSEHTTPAEKELFIEGRKKYTALMRMDEEPGLGALIHFLEWGMKVSDVFNDDARSQGIYVPDGTTMQSDERRRYRERNHCPEARWHKSRYSRRYPFRPTWSPGGFRRIAKEKHKGVYEDCEGKRQETLSRELLQPRVYSR